MAACGATTSDDPSQVSAGAGGACASSSWGGRNGAGAPSGRGLFVAEFCGITIYDAQPLPTRELYGFEGTLNGCPLRLAPAAYADLRTAQPAGYDGAMAAWAFVLENGGSTRIESIAVAFTLKEPHAALNIALEAGMQCLPSILG